MSPTSKYAKAHEATQGPGDGRPAVLQNVEDEGRENDLGGKLILITDCSSGLGIETARALGATLYLTARDLPKAKSALYDLVDSPRVHLLYLDLRSLDVFYTSVEEFKSKSKSLDILIENAGVVACPEDWTADGLEKNSLGPTTWSTASA